MRLFDVFDLLDPLGAGVISLYTRRLTEAYAVSDGAGGWLDFQVSDGSGGWIDYEVSTE